MITFLKNYSRTDKLIIASGIIGNLLETFDVMICAFLAKIVSATFFPAGSSLTGLIYTFNIFLVGYLSRPIGSLLIGLYADQAGRKKMLIFSIIMVGLCTGLIGTIPSYQSIGIASTILFLLFRILQNISVGGEYISSIAYLIESAKNNRKGFYGSWVSVGFNCGTLFASVLAFIFIYLSDLGFIPSWSWRLIFIFSIIGMSVGLWIRKSLPESIGFILEQANLNPRSKVDILKGGISLLRSHPYQCLGIISIAWLGVSETATIFIYSPIHMTTINKLTQPQALGINSISLILLISLIPIFGYLSDYFKRSNMLIIASTAFIILSFPYFWCMSYGNYAQILLAKLVFSIPSACFYATAPVLITETFPLSLRCTSLALIYQTAASLAAGLTPLILLHYAQGEYTSLSPSYFLTISAILGIIGLFIIKMNPINSNHHRVMTKQSLVLINDGEKA